MADDAAAQLEPSMTRKAEPAPEPGIVALLPPLGAAMADGTAAAARIFAGWVAVWSDLAVLPNDFALEMLGQLQRSRLLAMGSADRHDLADPLAFYGRSVEAAFADLGDMRSRLVERMAESGRRLDRRWREETARAADALIAARQAAQATSEASPPPR